MIRTLMILIPLSVGTLAYGAEESVSDNAVDRAGLKRAISTGKQQSSTPPPNKPFNARLRRSAIIRDDNRRITSLSGTNPDKPVESVRYRSTNLAYSNSSRWYEIYNAHSYLEYDYDGDGYFSEFTIEFDADTSGGYADVYAELFISAGGGAWVHYHTTDVFTIYGENSDDEYRVTTRLRYDFPTGDYDILIDLYEAGYAGIVATLDGFDDADLYGLPLEDYEHELGSYDTVIDSVTTEKFSDSDDDGFYTELSIAYNVDTIEPGTIVYTELTLTHSTDFSEYVITSEPFELQNQVELIEVFLDDGFTPALYDAEIKIVDNTTNRLLAIAAQEFSSLSKIPLESDEYDDTWDRADDADDYFDAGDAAASSESGGGAMSYAMLLMLLSFITRKRQASR